MGKWDFQCKRIRRVPISNQVNNVMGLKHDG